MNLVVVMYVFFLPQEGDDSMEDAVFRFFLPTFGIIFFIHYSLSRVGMRVIDQMEDGFIPPRMDIQSLEKQCFILTFMIRSMFPPILAIGLGIGFSNMLHVIMTVWNRMYVYILCDYFGLSFTYAKI